MDSLLPVRASNRSTFTLTWPFINMAPPPARPDGRMFAPGYPLYRQHAYAPVGHLDGFPLVRSRKLLRYLHHNEVKRLEWRLNRLGRSQARA